MSKLPVNQKPKPKESVSVDPISQRIKAVRAEKGISQKEFAEMLGIERSQYNRMESRAMKMTVEMLTRIAQALGVETVSLLNDGLVSTWTHSFRVNYSQEQVRDKELIIQGFRNSRQALLQQVELGLLRGAALIELEKVSDTEAGKQHMTHYLNFDYQAPALYDFPYASERQTLLGQTYTGFQFVFLALWMNLTESNFSNLITRCIESYVIPDDTLYAKAFLHLRNAKEVLVVKEGDVLRRRWQLEDQEAKRDSMSPDANMG